MSSTSIASSAVISFKQRFGKINWDQIIKLDLDSILGQGDIDSLQNTLENLTYSILDRDDLNRINDSNMVKAFKLSQLAFEYLMSIHSQLDTSGKEYLNKQKTLYEENSQLKDSLISLEKEVKSLKTQLIDKKRVVKTHELLLRQPGSAALMNKFITRANSITCEVCQKAFISNSFLEDHKKRRHTLDITHDSAPSFDMSPLIEVFKTFADQRIQAVTDAHRREIESLKELMKLQLEIQKDHEASSYQKLLSYQSQQANIQEDMFKKLLIETQFEKEKIQENCREDERRVEDNVRKLRNLKETHEALQREIEEKERNLDMMMSHETSMFESIDAGDRGFKNEYIESPFREHEPEQGGFYKFRNEKRTGTPPPSLLTRIPEKVVTEERENEASIHEKQVFTQINVEEAQDYEIPVLAVNYRESFNPEVAQEIEVLHMKTRESNAGEILSDEASDQGDFHSKSNAGEILSDSERSESMNLVEYIPENDNMPLVVTSEVVDLNGSIEIVSRNSEKIELQAIQPEKSFEMSFEQSGEIVSGKSRMSRRQACKLLGINRTLHKQYFFIVDKFLNAPLPEFWEEHHQADGIYYVNTRTGEATKDNPNIKLYANWFQTLKTSHFAIFDKILLLVDTTKRVFRPKDGKELNSHFEHDYRTIENHRSKMYEEFVLNIRDEPAVLGSLFNKRAIKNKKKLIEIHVQRLIENKFREDERPEREEVKVNHEVRRQERMSDISVIKDSREVLEHEKDLWSFKQGIEHIHNKEILKDTLKMLGAQHFQEGKVLGDYYFVRNSGVNLDEYDKERALVIHERSIQKLKDRQKKAYDFES